METSARMYLSLLPSARERRAKRNTLEPSEWAALSLAFHLKKPKYQNQEVILVADFCCGDMEFAKYFNHEIAKEDHLKGKKFQLEAFDFSPNQIQIPQSCENLSIAAFDGKDCSDERNFETEKYDFIISTCALWGNGDSWKNIIKSALFALKEDGCFFVAESKKRFTTKNLQSLPQAGIHCSAPRLAPGLNRLDGFNEEFTGMAITKDDDYNPDALLTYLTRD